MVDVLSTSRIRKPSGLQYIKWLLSCGLLPYATASKEDIQLQSCGLLEPTTSSEEFQAFKDEDKMAQVMEDVSSGASSYVEVSYSSCALSLASPEVSDTTAWGYEKDMMDCITTNKESEGAYGYNRESSKDNLVE